MRLASLGRRNKDLTRSRRSIAVVVGEQGPKLAPGQVARYPEAQLPTVASGHKALTRVRRPSVREMKT